MTKLSLALLQALGVGLAASVVSVPALAQQTAQTRERIEVTGSNIKRVETETAAPVQVIAREEIENSGKLTVGEYLQTLTVDSQGTVPPSFGNGFAAGAIGISLRGLGASSTLVLLNGRRIAPYGLADDGQKVFTDLSSIPIDAIERIEILKDGASAIYGSDAIAGVVNIILRKDFTGVIGRASFGTSRYHDGDQTKASLTAGFGELNKDRYNAFFNIEYSKADRIQYADRQNRKWIGQDDARPFGYDQHGTFFSPGGYIVPGNATSSLPGNVRNPATGQYQPLPGCSQFLPVMTPPDEGGGCLLNGSALYRTMLPEQETWNLFGRGTLAISSVLEGYGEVSYSKRETRFDSTPTGVSGSWGYPGGPVNASSGPGATVLAATHPDNPLGVGGVRLRFLNWNLGPRTSHSDNEFKRLAVGLKGSGAGWDFDTAYVYSETDLTNERGGYVRYSMIRAALGDPTSPLFPYRIGINANLNTDAVRAAISPMISAHATSKLQVLDFKASRDVMKLEGGPMTFAGGIEFRREEQELKPTTYTDIGDIVGLGFSAYSGTKDVTALYGELLAPVHRMVEISGAVRHDHYSIGENSTTPKLGVKFTPTRQIMVRGTYAEGFRQPNAAESGVGGLAAFTATRDPLRCPGGTPAPGGATTADCAVQVAIITTPDPSLKPEKSKNYTVGFVLEPLQTTSISVDFWRIKRKDEINQTTITAALADPSRVVRSDNNLTGVPNSGTLLAVSAPYVNSASSKVEGVDLDFRHRMNLGDRSRLTFETRWTRLNKFERTEADGTVFQWAGTHGNCDVTNCIGTPKDKVNVILTFDSGPLTVSGLMNWRSSIKNVFSEGEDCASFFANGDEAPNGCRIASFYTVDLSARFRFQKNLEVYGSVQNLFDKVAPFDPTTYGAVNFNPMDISGAIGRYYTVGLKYTFR